MGCGASKRGGHGFYLGDRPRLVKRSRGHCSIADNSLVRELFDEDVHEAYDFTGPVLGSGAFATVLRVKDRMSGVEYAIKQVNLAGIKHHAPTMRMLYNEIEGMKMLSHPNIVRLQEVYQPKDEEKLYLVLDRLEGGSVDALRKKEGRIGEGHAAYIIAQVVDAVRYCHSLNMAHRDLKLANCMFEDTSAMPIVKIIDFGLCAEFKDGHTSSAFVGTMTYAAPEVIVRNKGHGIECDMWSVGVMTYALVGGKLPFDTDDEGALQYQIKYIPHSYEDEVWKGVSALCRDFIDKCLNKNRKKRMTAKQAQAHPWIKRAAKAMEGTPLSKEAMLSMAKFQATNTFEKIAMELVAYSYEPSQIKDLERHFLEMDTTGTGAVTLSEFKAAIMERRRAIVQQQQEEKALNAMTAEPSDGDGDSTIVAGTGQESREEPPDEKLEGGGRDGSGRGELIASQEREKERGGGESVAASGEDCPTAASTMVDRGMGEAGGEDENSRRMYGKQSTTSSTGASVVGRFDEEGVERIFEAIDVDGSGTIEITEFVAACLVKRQINDAAIKAAFNRLDFTRAGLISAEDVSMYLGDSFDKRNMEQYMREVSSRSDGLVTLDDFSKCLKARVLKPRAASKPNSQRTTLDSPTPERETGDSNRPDLDDRPENSDRPEDK